MSAQVIAKQDRNTRQSRMPSTEGRAERQDQIEPSDAFFRSFSPRGMTKTEHYATSDSPVNAFVAANVGMCLRVGYKTLGAGACDPREAVAEATIASLEAIRSFDWRHGSTLVSYAHYHLTKVMQEARQGGCLLPTGHNTHGQQNDDAVEQSVEEFYKLHPDLANNDLEGDGTVSLEEQHIANMAAPAGIEALSDQHAAWKVDTESFEGHIPERLLMALKALNQTIPFSSLETIYRVSHQHHLLQKIRADLKKSFKESSYQVYVGEILNGTFARVILCAESEEAAMIGFKRHGVVINVKEWSVKVSDAQKTDPII